MLLPLVASADATPIDGIHYKLNSETMKAEVAPGPAYKGDIVIPDKVWFDGQQYDVTGIGVNAFKNCTSLASVDIPSSVTTIGNSAFYNCKGLTSVIIPNSVTSIGSSAFDGCSGLMSVTIPNSVTYIPYYTFGYCTSLTSVDIPSSVTGIGSFSFRGCSNLEHITIHNPETNIWNQAFIETKWYESQDDGPIYIDKILYVYKGTMPANTNIDIEEGTVTISPYAFIEQTNLASVTIPNSVTNIGENAFTNCRGLTSITIPSSVTSISQYAFSNCSGLTSVNIEAENPPSLENKSFSDYDVPFYVPAASVGLYQSTSPWNKFTNTKPLGQCAKPTITMADGKLSFSCDTEGATFVYHLTTPSAVDGEGLTMELPTVCTVSVYAKKVSCLKSETATMELNLARVGKEGDVNHDNEVNAVDLTTLIDILLEK